MSDKKKKPHQGDPHALHVSLVIVPCICLNILPSVFSRRIRKKGCLNFPYVREVSTSLSQGGQCHDIPDRVRESVPFHHPGSCSFHRASADEHRRATVDLPNERGGTR